MEDPLDLISCHYDNTELRIYENVLIEGVAPDYEPDVDAICLVSSAIKRAFENLLAVPVCYFFYFPEPLSSIGLYNITMLCRWFKFASSTNPLLVAVLSQPELKIDVPALLEGFQIRMESARKEMKAAHAAAGIIQSGILRGPSSA